MKKDVFCIHPWSSITIEPPGDLRVCCFVGETTSQKHFGAHGIQAGDTRGLAFDDDIRKMNVLTTPLTDGLNSQIHKEIRKYQLEDKRHPACHVCWKRDDAAIAMSKKINKDVPSNSMRIANSFKNKFMNYNYDHPLIDDILNVLYKADKDDGTINSPKVLSLDLRFDNLCNQKCIMCSPMYSNLWYEDYMKLRNTNNAEFDQMENKRLVIFKKENGTYNDDLIDWQNSDVWWNQFDLIKSDLRFIYVTGGEPFLSKAHSKMLDILIKNDLAKNIILDYDTNMSVINSKILNQLQHFKKIIMRMSIDDTENRYELIRFPGKWKTLLKNIETLEQSAIHKKFDLSIASCIGIHSIFAPLRLYKEFGKRYSLHFRLLDYPIEYDIGNLSSNIKKKIISTYDSANIPTHIKSLIVGHLTQNINSVTVD